MRVRVDVVPGLPVSNIRWKRRLPNGAFRAGVVVRPEVPKAERDRLVRELLAAVESHCQERTLPG